jgi:glycine/D-amino acid oxidase-like deaminating enzyme
MSSLAPTPSASAAVPRPLGACRRRGLATSGRPGCEVSGEKERHLVGTRRRGSRCRSACESRDDGNEASTAGEANARRIAIVGAGFAGIATAYHVFRQVADAHAEATADGNDRMVAPVRVTLIDEKRVAGGASGVAAGLLHPYTPRGKIIWRGTEGVTATLELVEAAENAERAMEATAMEATAERDEVNGEEKKKTRPTVSPRENRGRAIARRAGVCRPARSLKQARDLAKHAPASFEAGGRGVTVSAEELMRLIPGMDVPPEVLEATKKRPSRRSLEDDDNDDDDASLLARPLTRADRKAASAKRLREKNAPVTSALHIPEGLVLDTTRYLASLWDAARLLASSGETPEGCSATMEIRTVASIAGDSALNEPGAYDAVVIACGAAAGSVQELQGDVLPTQLQGGHVVELVPVFSDGNENGGCWPDDAPGVLGSPYIAPLGPERLLVGTTKEYGASVADARRAGEVPLGNIEDDEKEDAPRAPTPKPTDRVTNSRLEIASRASAAARELVASASAAYPPLALENGAWRVDVVRYGVRANPPRSNLGSLPLVGRISAASDDAVDAKTSEKKNWWYVGGLGARGLVYHGMLGAIVAAAALSGDDARVPPELRFDPGARRTVDE